MPGEIHQVIIQVDSEMTMSDSWYPYIAFKGDRYTDTHLFLAVIQQFENILAKL